LFAPEWIAENSGFTIIRDNYRSFFGISMVLSGALFISSGLSSAFSWIKRRWKYYNLLKVRKEYLCNLTPEEKLILILYLANNTNTLAFPVNDGVVNGLESKRIIWRASVISMEGDIFPYNIQPFVWKYLKKYPELLSI
jgi:hypothetical protein